MSDFMRLVVLLVLAGAAVTVAGMTAVWFFNEERRIRSALKYVLGASPEAMVSAHGRGAGFAFSRGVMAVTWDQGAWCLTYRIAELVGAEVIVDGHVVGRAHHGEPRRAIDRSTADAGLIVLRLLFDDLAHPDFDITLWSDAGEPRKGSAAEAGQEANRWLARAESILRRQGGGPKPPGPTVARPPPPPPPKVQAESQAAAGDAGDDDDPPF